jgi:cell division protein FtsI/penicillin-binding protein 2
MRDLGIRAKTGRINFVFICLILGYLVIVGRLYFVQIVKGEHYKAWAQGLEDFSQEPSAERGEIFFRDGQPLAINKNFSFVFASPPNVKNPVKTAETLAAVLKLDEKDVAEKIQKDALYALLKVRLSEEEIKALKESNFPGIYVKERKERYYPQGTMAAQVAGFVDDNGNGQYGLEEYYNDELAKGEDLILNLDYNIQYSAEQLIAKAREDLNTQTAEVVVVDPGNGDVLAMAKNPNFDPNNYKDFAKKEETIKLFKNNSCQELFEPGSVFKPFTMASALNEGKITPDTRYYDAGLVQIGGWPIYNYGQRSYGEQTMTQVLEKSINTGAVFAKNQLGNEAFAKYIEEFGLFEPTGIDIPEAYSQNLEFKKGYEINYATAAFGQGVQITSMQLIRGYCALANGGWLVQPSIVKNGRKNPDPSKHRQIISKDTSDTIKKMLVSVIENGYSKKAKIPGYSIAGKTGTAQLSWAVYDIDRKGYSDQTMQSFIGFFPAYDPKYLALIKLKAPEAKTAEYSALPVFHELSKQILYLNQVPPDVDVQKADERNGQPVTVPAKTEAAPSDSGKIQ